MRVGKKLLEITKEEKTLNRERNSFLSRRTTTDLRHCHDLLRRVELSLREKKTKTKDARAEARRSILLRSLSEKIPPQGRKKRFTQDAEKWAPRRRVVESRRKEEPPVFFLFFSFALSRSPSLSTPTLASQKDELLLFLTIEGVVKGSRERKMSVARVERLSLDHGGREREREEERELKASASQPAREEGFRVQASDLGSGGQRTSTGWRRSSGQLENPNQHKKLLPLSS